MRATRAALLSAILAAFSAACGSSGSGGFDFDAAILLPHPDTGAGVRDAGSPLTRDSGQRDASLGGHDGGTTTDGPKEAAHDGTTGAGDAADGTVAPMETGVSCVDVCSDDFTSVVDCHGNVVTTCAAGSSCDDVSSTCQTACKAAADDHRSAGCEYYATQMDMWSGDQGVCYAAFIANTWTSPAHITVDYAGSSLPVASFAFTPSGSGASITYTAYDATAGIAPGEMVILFLAGSDTGANVPCPEPTAMAEASVFNASGIGSSFHIVSDVPVAGYQMNPYGGGSAAVTGASLLLPTSVWSTDYIAVTVSPDEVGIGSPSLNIIASKDNTSVTITPTVAIAGGGALPAGPAGAPYTFTLQQGQQAQFSQAADLTGSMITSTAPIGLMAGQQCMHAPAGVSYCDHGEQMVPPKSALGSQYAAVMFRPRVAGDEAIWHMIGAADGTNLTYSTPVGGPATLNEGQVVDFDTATPFTVVSQDSAHPFMLFTYMSGSQWSQLSDLGGYGDPDFVLDVPPAQFESSYVFFTDPTYPETDLVIIREATAGVFSDVTLDCAGVLTGWQPVGNYEWTRADLSTGNFGDVGACSNGTHSITSDGLFGITVWGWGTPLTTEFTANVSYGYPGGMNVEKINHL